MKTIHAEDDTPVVKAILLMTDEWIESGQYSDQTILDMRDVIKELLNLKAAADDLNSIVDGPFNIRWSHNGVRLTDTPQWCAFFVALQKALK